MIHSTAVIDKGATILEGTQIWHWTHVSSSAKIGKNCSIGQSCFFGNNSIIGNNVKIQNNVSVFDNVIIEDDAFIGPSVVFTNVVNPRSFISRKKEYKKTIIKKGSSIGANSTIICGKIIVEYAFIGAGSVVTKDAEAFALMMGVPARQVGWMSRFGERLDLPIKGFSEAICAMTSEKYILEDKKVRVLL